jgi:uncharacterized protein involved in exopolysaccharide biosynthesis
MSDPAEPRDQEPAKTSSARALIERVLVALMKRRLGLVLAFALAGVVAFLVAPHLPLTWVSEGVLQLRKSLATATSENAGMEAAETDGKITEDYREVQTELLQSELLHRAVATRMYEEGIAAPVSLKGKLVNLFGTEEPASREEAIDQLTQTVASLFSAKRPLKSPIVSLAAKHSDAVTARRLLQILVEEYAKALQELYDVDPILTAARAQAEAAAAAFQAALLRRDALTERAGVHDPIAQLAVERGALAEFEKQLALREASRAETAERAARLSNGGMELPPEFPSEPTRIENKQRVALLNLLEAARRRLIDSPFVEGSAEYTALLDPVRKLEAELETQPPFLVEINPPLPNTAWAHFQTEVSKFQADARAEESAARSLAARVAEQRERVALLESAAADYERLQREVEHLEEVAKDKRTTEYRVQRVRDMQSAAQLWSYRMIQEPTLPTRPQSPGRRMALLMLFVTGCFLALAITLAAGLLDPSIASAVEVERCTGSAPLACVPDLRSRRSLRSVASTVSAKPPRPWTTGSGPALFGTLGVVGRLVDTRLDRMLSDAIETTDDGSPCVLVICAPHAGAGTSTLAANLAARLLRRGDGMVRIVHVTDSVVPRPEPPDGVESCTIPPTSQAVRALPIAGARYVIVDAPPVLESESTLDLCTQATACLLVARGDVTRKSALREAAAQVVAVAHGKVGVVLNALDLRLPAALQSI